MTVFSRLSIATLTPIASALLLSACLPSDIDIPSAPQAQLLFPSANVLVAKNQITLRGTASDDGSVKKVVVNNVEATTSDGFANWQVTLDLEFGAQEVSITATDDESLTTTYNEAVVITYKPQLLQGSTGGMAWSALDNRLYMSDIQANEIIAFDPASGQLAKRIPTFQDAALSTAAFPENLINNDQTGQLYFSDDSGVIMAVNKTTGAHTLVSSDTFPDTSLPLSSRNIADLGLDTRNQRLIGLHYAGASGNEVLEIDLASGARSIINDDNSMVETSDLAVDSGAQMVYILGQRRRLYSVDLSDNSLTEMMDYDSSPFSSVIEFDFDNTLGELLVLDYSEILAEFNLQTEVAEVITDPDTPADEVAYTTMDSMIFDQVETMYFWDDEALSLYSADRQNGTRAVEYDWRIPTLAEESDVVLMSLSDTYFLHNQPDDNLWIFGYESKGPGSTAFRYTLDTSTGAQVRNDIAEELSYPVYDATNNRILAQVSGDAIASFDPDTLTEIERWDVSANGGPYDLAFDETRQIAYMLDDDEYHVWELDLSDGSMIQTLIADESEDYEEAIDLTIDRENDRLLMIDANNNILAIPLDHDASAGTLDATILSDVSDVPAGIQNPDYDLMAIDEENSRVILLQDSSSGTDIVAVDLATGNKSLIADLDNDSSGFTLENITDIRCDGKGNLMIIDEDTQAVYWLDLTTGEMAIRAR